jgi:hypothetical protein
VKPEKGTTNIPPAARKRGSDKANDRRRRYAPIDLAPKSVLETDADHDEYLFLNALGEKGGPWRTPIEMAKGGPWGTDISIDINQGAPLVPITGHRLPESFPLSSEANQIPTSISSLSDQSSETAPHRYGDGVAGASVPRATPLARPEGTEYDAAHARANDRRAS